MNSDDASNDGIWTTIAALDFGGLGYGIGISIGILLLITTVTLTSYFCTRR